MSGQEQNATDERTDSFEARPTDRRPSSPVVCLIGDKSIVQAGVILLLERYGITITRQFDRQADIAEALSLAEAEECPCQAAVLILIGSGPFRTFHYISDLLGAIKQALPLVILSDRISRGHVYTAIRSGAKAYVGLDGDPSELVKAINMAAQGKTYLCPAAAALVAEDIFHAGQAGRKNSLAGAELSPREIEIVQLLCEGHISRRIGQQLHISPKTVENHRYNIYKKCGVENIAGLIRYAIDHGMVSV